jgi:hypothetical protein
MMLMQGASRTKKKKTKKAYKSSSSSPSSGGSKPPLGRNHFIGLVTSGEIEASESFQQEEQPEYSPSSNGSYNNNNCSSSASLKLSLESAQEAINKIAIPFSGGQRTKANQYTTAAAAQRHEKLKLIEAQEVVEKDELRARVFAASQKEAIAVLQQQAIWAQFAEKIQSGVSASGS